MTGPSSGPRLPNRQSKTSLQTSESHIQRTRRIYHHRLLQLGFWENIPNCASSDTQESRTGESIKKARNDQGLNVLRHCAGNDPDKEEKCRQDVDRLTPIKLNISSASTPPKTWKTEGCPFILAVSKAGI